MIGSQRPGKAQTRVYDVTMQMHQRIEALKQKARQQLSERQKVTTKLGSELALKEEALGPLWFFWKTTGSDSRHLCKMNSSARTTTILQEMQRTAPRRRHGPSGRPGSSTRRRTTPRSGVAVYEVVRTFTPAGEPN